MFLADLELIELVDRAALEQIQLKWVAGWSTSSTTLFNF